MRESNVAVLNRYHELQPKNGRINTPRTGYYSIIEVYTNTVYSTLYEANCLWKESEADLFDPRAVVNIQLLSLKENAKDPGNFDPESLGGKVIHVESTSDSEVKWKGQMIPLVICSWTISNATHITRQLPTIWGQSSSLNDNTPISELLHDFNSITAEYFDLENEEIENAIHDENPGDNEGYSGEGFDDDLYPVE